MQRTPSDKLQIVRSQIRSPLDDGDDPTVANAFVYAIFVEVKTTFLLVIEEVEILLGKFLHDYHLVLPAAQAADLSMPKLSESISSVSTE